MKVPVRSTSVSDMRFKDRSQETGVRGVGNSILVSCIAFLAAVVFLTPDAYCHAEVLERIVAIVDDDVIMLSELNRAMESAEKAGRETRPETVLNEMINRKLLLTEAKKFWTGVSDSRRKTIGEKEVINELIDRRIKAFIHVPYEDIEDYYKSNSSIYAGKEFEDVRDEIETLLTKEELRVRLREFISDLRKKAYIRIQLGEN